MINHALLGYHLTQHALHAALNVSSLSLPLPRLSLLPAVVTCHLLEHSIHDSPDLSLISLTPCSILTCMDAGMQPNSDLPVWDRST